MPSFASIATGLLAALPLVAGHMEMSFPPPFRSKFNPHATNIDYSMTSPLSADGSNFPCKGYQADLGTPAGASTATFAPGSTHNFTIVGGASHGGGSCQASLSYDGGKTFTVIKSIIGGCPLSSSYDFTIPADAKTGDALFSWSWFNELGNREMYQNCAPITIGGGAAKRDVVIQERAAAFSSRPPMFVANVGNGCKTLDSTDVTFPNPGPDVQEGGGKPAPPSGSCGSAAPAGGAGAGGGSGSSPAPGSGSGNGGGNGAPAPAPTQSSAPAPTSAAPPKPSATRPGGIFITVPTAAEPTTLQTATKTPPAAAPSAAPAAPAPAPVAPAPAAPAPAPPASGSGAANTGPCTDEGAWNCIGGTSFQRCASGSWSAVIPMAPGTKCTPGTSSSLSMGRRSMRIRGSSA
ncbi:hypothetical protein QBC47DRAFT_392516 [Echria macrotheca]|uniref:Uncharacterized protein n=1 Tax=Echria macrotheca TaxID=438768 RepID=A0AAJ0B4T1_9PEZI|nr:hypothetical protein QBC47DRAFT_392516 [Echria macrotheca]